MRRMMTLLTVTMATTVLQAAPPTAEDWWTAMGRYQGDHLLKDGESGDVIGEFQVEWGVPFQRLNYRFQSKGGDVGTTMTGFCHWDDALGKVRFIEVETGPDGLVTSVGELADVDDATLTWNIKSWTEKEMVRSFQMKDVFGSDGVDRSIKMKSGKAIPTSFTWTPVNQFQRAFPVADQMVGSWNFTDNGEAKMMKAEWGPGKETLVETTYTVGADGKTTADSTITYMYDRVADKVRMHYLGGNGVSGWTTPFVDKVNGATVIEISWQGRNAMGDRIAALGFRKLDGDTMTLTMTEFKVEGVPLPEGAARDAMTTPKTLTRMKK